jgi:beta-phosphoglucomutase-like phosphatase (HAD superfamily)
VTIRAIVFDFDGVIANSEPLHFRAYREVLAHAGVTLDEKDYYARYLGYDDLGAFRQIGLDRAIAWSHSELAEMVQRKATLMEELERSHSVLFAGAADAVRRLAEARPLAIASGALRGEIERVLRREDLAKYFAAVVGAEDTPASKPAPDPYIRAVELLSRVTGTVLNPAECLAIEDSRWGLESARTAGLRTVAVAHTYAAAALADVADEVLPDLGGLTPEFLGRFE